MNSVPSVNSVYQVSGEYAMLHHGAAGGAFNLQATLMEVLTSMRRYLLKTNVERYKKENKEL